MGSPIIGQHYLCWYRSKGNGHAPVLVPRRPESARAHRAPARNAEERRDILLLTIFIFPAFIFIVPEISLPHAQLDPIDVAFYDPHLRKNSQRLYLSSSVLLGALVQLHRLHKDSCVIASFFFIIC